MRINIERRGLDEVHAMNISIFELNGAFSVEQVPHIRRFVERMHPSNADEDLASRMSMAAHELFENAVKFASDGQASMRIDIDHAARCAAIITRNRARVADLDELREAARKLREATDRMAYYLDLIRTSKSERGGLGIGRVAAEADMRVAVEFVDDLVVVRAELVPEHAA